ncbi:MAG: GNAT family N-acetyltransferase [Candidatus Zixiibacteriota bacterium]
MYFLKSKRLGFRLWVEEDFDLALDLWGNPEVTSLIGGPFSDRQIQERLEQEMANNIAYGVQYWPIFLLDNDLHVGCCGLRPYKPAEKIFEIGVHLKPQYQGIGLAQEAVLTVADYAFKSLKATGLFAGHNPFNEASRRLLKKLGFRYTHDEFYQPTGLLHPSYMLFSADLAEK